MMLLMSVRAHVFVVDRFSYPVHRSKCFCGVKNPHNEDMRNRVYADLFAIRKGDIVFFYQRRIDEPPEERGFRGIFRVISEPFIDATDVGWGGNLVLGKCPHCQAEFSELDDASCPACGGKVGWISIGRKKVITQHILPNRVLIEPLEYFEKPVDDNTAYVNRLNKGTIWSMLFRKIYGPGRERSINQILPEEAVKLRRLLYKKNEGRRASFERKPYKPVEKRQIELELGEGGKVPYESVLQAWIMKNIDKGIPIFSDFVPTKNLEYWGNWVTYGIGGESVDILVLYKDKVRYKAVPIELKREYIDVNTIKQMYRYAYWMAQFSTAYAKPPVRSLILQPICIGFKASPSAINEVKGIREEILDIPYPENSCKVVVEPPILLTYNVSGDKIEFQEEFSAQS